MMYPEIFVNRRVVGTAFERLTGVPREWGQV